jgi:hypothetical protein
MLKSKLDFMVNEARECKEKSEVKVSQLELQIAEMGKVKRDDEEQAVRE